MDKLPKGWKNKTVGDVLEKIMTGTTPPMRDLKYYQNPSISWYSPSDFNDNIKTLSNPARKLDKSAIDEGKAKLFNENSLLLVAIGATVGKIGMIKERSCSNQQITAIEFKKNVFPDFAYYWFKYIKSEIIKNASAATLPIINQNGIKQPFILPPFPEQTRIVSKLDALFARINKSIALLEENIKHTKALMASVLEEVFGGGDIPIANLCIINPKKSEIKDFDSDTEVSFLPMADLKEHQIQFEVKQVKKLNEVNTGYTYFRDNDVLIAKVTPCFENGKAGIAQNLKNSIGFGSTEYHIIRTKGNVLSEWIYYSVMTARIREEGVNNMTGSSGLKRVPAKFIETWKIKQPSIEEQKEIIQKIQKIDEKLKATIAFQQSKLTYLKAMKSSLLDRAFKGGL